LSSGRWALSPAIGRRPRENDTSRCRSGRPPWARIAPAGRFSAPGLLPPAKMLESNIPLRQIGVPVRSYACRGAPRHSQKTSVIAEKRYK